MVPSTCSQPYQHPSCYMQHPASAQLLIQLENACCVVMCYTVQAKSNALIRKTMSSSALGLPWTPTVRINTVIVEHSVPMYVLDTRGQSSSTCCNQVQLSLLLQRQLHQQPSQQRCNATSTGHTPLYCSQHCRESAADMEQSLKSLERTTACCIVLHTQFHPQHNLQTGQHSWRFTHHHSQHWCCCCWQGL